MRNIQILMSSHLVPLSRLPKGSLDNALLWELLRHHMKKQIPVDPAACADIPHDFPDDGTHEVTADVAYKRLAIVNVVMVGLPGAPDRQWVLVDAGIGGTASVIEHTARERFGRNSRPAAIILTHGHFDHVGALPTLAKKWNVPIYAHELERPYLDGTASYPPPDPKVGGGMMSTLSSFYPRGPIDVGPWIQNLPADGTVPSMKGWRWLHTPGHSAGHISLWRETDGLLLAGDAFVTTAQESAYAVAVQSPEMHGPPMYFTADWAAAGDSVRRLAALAPHIAVTGHGSAMKGPLMLSALKSLAGDFERVATPQQGRYLDRPARADDGSAYRAPH